jgi:hypothetical protein
MQAPSAHNNIFMWLGVALLAAGLSGHLFAAVAIGGHYIAYRDHIFGFVFLTLVAGLILVLLGRRYWRGRHDVTVLILGVVQAVIGLWIYMNRFNV